MDLQQHLTRQVAFSRATFGPGARTHGVIDHMQKELVEVAQATDSDERVKEWTDLVILALDGLTRELWAQNPRYPAPSIAAMACTYIIEKQGKNELRTWPDWRTAPADKAIEHVRGNHD